MNISDFKTVLEDLVHTKLYTSSKISNEQKKKYKELKSFLKKNNNLIEDLRVLLVTRNNENYFAYDEYINEFLVNSYIDTKMEILNNQSNYEDIIKNNDIYINIWKSLNNKEKLTYLEEKKKYTKIDLLLINDSLRDNGNFKDNIILSEIINNEDIRNKIEPFTIELNYSYTLLSYINLSDFEECSIFTKDTYTKFLLKKCKSFDEFYQIYESNNKIYNLISNNSLVFNNSDNKNIYKFILDNPNFIGKFSSKYLDLFNIMEITKISKLKTLDSDAFSAIVQKLYRFNPDDADKYFSEDNLRKCSKHSIVVYPFEYISEELQDKIFNTYTLFNRFIDTIMIEAINHRFEEEDIVNILRNDTFITDTSAYGIELLLNKLSFKAAFNMLQRKIIFNKINNLHVTVDEKDAIFFKGFLDSPVLVNKSEHNMIFEMLNILDKDDVLYYVTLPYIMNKLSNYEIINLALNKDISVSELLDHNELKNTLNTTDIISYIDKCFEKNIDLNIFKNKNICKEIFNLSDEQFDSINFDEVNYLFETVRMKSLLSKQDSKVTVLSYKSVLASYLVLGLDDTLKLISDGNKDITLDEIKNLQKEIVGEKILLFKENNSPIFQNMAKKIISNLNEIEDNLEINEFTKKIRKNSYLDNIVYLVLANDFDKYNGVIEKLYGYLKYRAYDEYASKKEIYDYSKRFTEHYINKKINEYNEEFEKIILVNFKPKENIIYNKRKEIGKSFLDKLKFKLFVRSLTDPNKEIYSYYFRDGYPVLDVKNKFIKYLANHEVDFDSILEHVLHPIVNDRFDKENCLSKLGINKPKNTDEYLKYLNDLKLVTELNTLIEKFKSIYNSEETISIMNYICYGNKLIPKLKKKDLTKVDKAARSIYDLDGEIYVDKSALKFIYKDNMDVYNIEEIIEYNNYLEILSDIVTKTENYVSRNIDNNKVRTYFAHDYFNAVNTDDCVFPITSKYYEPRKRVLSLNDLERVFNGYELSLYKPLEDSLKDFLFVKKNLIMVADGYYDGIVDNLGIIMSKWDKIQKYIKDLNVDLNKITLISVENILTLINFENNILGKSIDKKVIKSICENGYYEINDLNKRINMLVDLFKESYKRVTSTIPYLCYRDDIYKVEILDNYNQDVLMGIDNSLYEVGAIGNDFLHYSIMNKNGLQIGIYKDDILVAKVLGLRSGNTIYLNAVEGVSDSNYNELLQLFANELIRITKDDVEPINFVTIVNNDLYNNENALKLDSTLCPNINNPINKVYYDFELFSQYTNLLNVDDMYTNYKDNISTLLASDGVVDKNNFKSYDADDRYYRKRNSVIRLSNNIGEEYLNKIDTILYLCKLEDDSIDINNITLSMIDTIYLGDDYVIFVTNRDNILQFVLPYDERASKEINLIIEQIKKDYE